jgi:hypothetical protein
MDMKLSIEECKEKLVNADMVLIGIGKELSINVSDIIADNDIYIRFKDDIDCLSVEEAQWIEYAIYYHIILSGNNEKINNILGYYNKLSKLIEDKNYFIVSVCNDEIIRYSNLKQDRIVTPCGTILKKECHVGCKSEVFDSIEDFEMIYKKLEMMYRDDFFDKQLLMNIIPYCDNCEATMELNLLSGVSYSEEGYLDRWEYYNKWLTGTVNRQLVMLELGVNFDTPTVIRWPFEKICLVNNKSTLIRVSEQFAMLPPEIGDKAVALSMNTKEFLDTI